MFNVRSVETIEICKCKNVIEFRRKYNKYPSAASHDSKEIQMAKWLSRVTCYNNNIKYFPILNQMAINAGLPDMFTSQEGIAIEKTTQLIEFYKNTGKYPSRHSNNPTEARLGVQLNTLRQSKANKNKSTFYPILDQMAINAGLPDMFNLIDRKGNAIQMLYKLIKFKQQLGIMPSVYTNNSDEKQIAKWISHMRTAKKGGSPNKFYSELDDIAISHGLPNIFNSNWKDDLK